MQYDTITVKVSLRLIQLVLHMTVIIGIMIPMVLHLKFGIKVFKKI